MAHSFPFRYAPLKVLYLLFTSVSLFVKLLGWTILFAFPSFRPRPSWTYRQTLYISVFRHLLAVFDRTGPINFGPTHKYIAKSKIAKGIWCEPKPDLMVGRVKKWAEAAKVETIRVPGYWYTSVRSQIPTGAKAQTNEKVFYHLHGGGYVFGTAHPRSGVIAPIHRLLESGTVNRLFSLEYRLSSSAPFPVANPFPAALIDAVTGYNYLVSDLGFDPDNIILIGDSAGGHLALCLIRYLVETSVLPVPGKFIGHSPLCDITCSHFAIPNSSHAIKADFLKRIDKGVWAWAWVSFAGPLQEDPNDGPTKNPYLSPARLGPDMETAVSFEGFPETFLVFGGAERMRDDLRTLKQRMVRDMGEGKVTSHEAPDAVHCFLYYPWDEPEKTEALRLLSSWVDRK